jgi:hypothetical protein
VVRQLRTPGKRCDGEPDQRRFDPSSRPGSGGSIACWNSRGTWGLILAASILPLIGHHNEDNVPAFVDDLRNLSVDPLFNAAEGLCTLRLADLVASAI